MSFGEIPELTAVTGSFILTSLCLMMSPTGEPPTTQNECFTKPCPTLQNHQLVDDWWHHARRATYLNRSIFPRILKIGVSHVVWIKTFRWSPRSHNWGCLFIEITYHNTNSPPPAAEREQKQKCRRPLTTHGLCPITSNSLPHAPSKIHPSVLSPTPLLLDNMTGIYYIRVRVCLSEQNSFISSFPDPSTAW